MELLTDCFFIRRANLMQTNENQKVCYSEETKTLLKISIKVSLKNLDL